MVAGLLAPIHIWQDGQSEKVEDDQQMEKHKYEKEMEEGAGRRGKNCNIYKLMITYS